MKISSKNRLHKDKINSTDFIYTLFISKDVFDANIINFFVQSSETPMNEIIEICNMQCVTILTIHACIYTQSNNIPSVFKIQL